MKKNTKEILIQIFAIVGLIAVSILVAITATYDTERRQQCDAGIMIEISGPRVTPIPYALNLAEVQAESSISDQVAMYEMPSIPIERYDTPVDMWVSAWRLNYRVTPSTENDDTIVDRLSRGDRLTVVGCVADSPWVVIDIAGNEYFTYSEYLSDTEITITTRYSGEDGTLTSTAGKIAGPSGNETFYNLDMSNCVRRIQSMGYSGDYWVREDGVKMFGPYIMVAADFSQRPLGTILECSLGTAIVVDTGGFVAYDPTRLDIAVTW